MKVEKLPTKLKKNKFSRYMQAQKAFGSIRKTHKTSESRCFVGLSCL